MGQSLADAAVSGTRSISTIAQRKQELLKAGDTEGLISLNRAIFGGATMMAKKDDADDDNDDGDDDEDEDDDESDEDEDDDTDDEDDDDAKGKRKKPDAKDRRIQELSAESKKHRLKASRRGKRIAELEDEIEQLKKGKKAKSKDGEDESDEDNSEVTELKGKNEELQEKLVRQQLRMEFTDLVTGDKPIARFKNPKKAFRLLDLDDVEIDEDGDIDGLDDAIKALAKSDPYLLVSSKDKDDEDEDDDDEDEDELSRRRKKSSGRPTGGKRKRGNPNRDKLVSKYPALRR